MNVTRTCILTGETNTRFVEGLTQAMVDAWTAGTLAQDAFKGISAEWREFIMTGILPSTWEETFPEDADSKHRGASAWTWDDELEYDGWGDDWDDGTMRSMGWDDPSDGVDLCPVDGRPLPPLDYKGRQIV